jgi:uncharacterized membrane protein YtjA (UPF0391 family)
MLRWSAVSLLIALASGFFGWSDWTSGAIEIGRILFVVFMVISLISVALGLFSRRSPQAPA